MTVEPKPPRVTVAGRDKPKKLAAVAPQQPTALLPAEGAEVISGATVEKLRGSIERLVDAGRLVVVEHPNGRHDVAVAGSSLDPARLRSTYLVKKRAERAAESAIEAEMIATLGPPPPIETLAQTLANPDSKRVERIRGIVDVGGTVTIVAPRKTGKTTLVANLVRALVTGGEFLEHFRVKRYAAGGVLILNYEMTRGMFAEWLVDAGLSRFGDLVHAWHLRGHANPLRTELGRESLREQLDALGVDAVIVDTFAQAFTGRNQNDAAEVAPFLAELRRVVGPERDLYMTVHAGWGAEHSRGSSALEDWPDTILTLSTDKDDKLDTTRYLSVRGRSSEELEGLPLSFDATTRTLAVDAAAPRKHEASSEKKARAAAARKAEREQQREADRHSRIEHDLERARELLVKETAGMTLRKLRMALGWANERGGEVVTAGLARGLLELDDSGRHAVYKLPAESQS